MCGPLKQVLNSTLAVLTHIFSIAKQHTSARKALSLNVSYLKVQLMFYCMFLLSTAIECSTRRLQLRYGTVSMTSHYYGGIVTYVCSYGYKLSRLFVLAEDNTEGSALV